MGNRARDGVKMETPAPESPKPKPPRLPRNPMKPEKRG